MSTPASVGAPTASKVSIESRRRRTVEVRIPSELGWERAAMDTAASVARLMGFSAERIEDIKTAVSEATLNAIEHGNALVVSRRVRISLVSAPERLEITVRDGSDRPFGTNIALQPAPSLADKLAGRSPPSGWGLFLIRSLVDHAEFSSTRAGNSVRMVVRLGP